MTSRPSTGHTVRTSRLRSVAALVAIIGLSLPAGASALTRTQANAIALRTLNPGRWTFAVAVLGMPSPLRRGTEVVEAGPGPTARGHSRVITHGLERLVITQLKRAPLKHPAWLFWQDLAPGAEFEHASTLLLVDDHSGKVVREQPESFYPLINGRPPPFLSPTAYVSPRFLVYANPMPNRRLARGGRSADAPSAQIARKAHLPNDCVITIGDRVDPLFKGDFELIDQTARKLGVDKLDATTVASLDEQIGKAEKRRPRCQDILIVIAAHGYPAIGSNIDSPGFPGKKIPESAHAQVGLKTTVKDAGGNDTVLTETFDAEQLRQILRRHRRTTFKLIISACFSGRWTELSDVPNLQVTATAARSDQMGFGYAFVGWGFKGTQKNGVISHSLTPFVNTASNPTHATTFMNGMLIALQNWASSGPMLAQTGDDLAKGIALAFSHSKDDDVSQQEGTTDPQLNVNPVAGPGGAPHAGWTIQGYNPPSSPKAGRLVYFTNTSSDQDGRIVSDEWKFGDGGTSTTPYPSHTYARPGIYTVSLKVTAEDGTTSTATTELFVSGAGTKPAALTDVPCSGAAGGYVDINIPSFAQNPTAALSKALTGCPGLSIANVKVVLVQGPAPGSRPDEIHDEWGNEKNHLHVTFDLTGSSGASGSGSATFTATWK